MPTSSRVMPIPTHLPMERRGSGRPFPGGGLDAIAKAVVVEARDAERAAETPEQLRARLGGRTLADIPPVAPEPLLLNRLDPKGQTILFGMGGSGKGTIAASWVTRLAAEGRRVLVLDFEDQESEWSRRVHGLGGLAARAAVEYLAPLGRSWGGERGSLWEVQADIRRYVEAAQIDYLVVDSISYATLGHDLPDSRTATNYGAAIQFIGLPSLNIGHTRREHGNESPFGSIYFHNGARVTWSLVKEGENSVLQNRKANSYEPQGKALVSVTWLDGLPREVAERSYTGVMADDIAEVLAAGPLNLVEIRDRLNAARDEGADQVKVGTVRTTLSRGIKGSRLRPQRFTVANEAGTPTYSLLDPA